MPIYEYRCADCGRVTSLFVRTVGAAVDPTCTRCSGRDLRKLVSRFAVMKSEERRLDDLSDPSNFAGVDEDDPKSVARWAKKMSQELGEDLGDDFREAIEQAEAGEMPLGGEEGGPDIPGGDDL